jgi:hypothetical protein
MSEAPLNFNLPPSVKVYDIPPPPSVYEGYMYKYTCINTNRKYAGIHKGELGDGYLHSSTCKEFNAILADKNSNLKFEVMRYGDYNELTVAEYKLLSEVNAKDNPEWFNKSNGAPKYKAIDTKKCRNMANRITNGEFDREEKDPIEKTKKLPKIQVRANEFSEHIKLIAQKIDDAGGSTDDCNRVVILENRRGKDVILDGNHTVRAIVESKHGRLVPVAYIPKEEHEEFTDSELIAIGNLLNKSEKIVKISADADDMVKFILKQYEQGVPVKDDTNKVFLTEMGFTNKQRTSIFKDAQTAINEDKLNKGNEVWIDWKIAEYAQELEKKVESYKNETTLALSLSSAMFKWDKIFNLVFFEGTKPNGKSGRKNIKKKLVVLVYHPNEESKKEWDGGLSVEIEETMKYYFKAIDFEYDIKEMRTTRKNESSKYFE